MSAVKVTGTLHFLEVLRILWIGSPRYGVFFASNAVSKAKSSGDKMSPRRMPPLDLIHSGDMFLPTRNAMGPFRKA